MLRGSFFGVGFPKEASMQLKLERGDTALLVIDVQERLCGAMRQDALTRMLNRTSALLEGAAALGLPVVFTEQYPKGLGPTLPALLERAPTAAPHEKVRFSACSPNVLEALGNRRQVLIAGMETHVCVYQTVRDLVAAGCTPFLAVDAVTSRTEEDRQVGLALCARAGAVATTAEAALFDLLGEAGTPEFKRVSQAVK
jgi:nicotinamidase-related amidase